MKKFRIFGIVAVFAAAVSVFAAQQAAAPKIVSEKMVVCGNKKLVLGQDGKIIVANASAEIAQIVPFTAYIINNSSNIDWTAYTVDECKVSVVDGKVVWQLFKTRNGKTFKSAEQTLEIQADGIIKLSSKLVDLADKELKHRNEGAYHITVPIAGNEGRKVVFNDSKTLEISADIKHGDWRAPEFKYAIYPDLPAESFTIICKKPETHAMAVYRVGKDVRFAAPFAKETRVGSVYIDLR